MPKICQITCHKILNSRGSWTIETQVELDDGSVGSQTIPEGASKGEKEALSIPVDKAVEIVSSVIHDALYGDDPFNQLKVDQTLIKMDGTANKSYLGANSILSVSLATSKAAAASKGWELWDYLSYLYSGKRMGKPGPEYPTPLFNIVNGGKHAHNKLSFQEFMVIPSKNVDIAEALEIGTTVYHNLEKRLLSGGFDVDVGDEGGFAPNGLTTEKVLTMIKESAAESYKPGSEVFFGMDVAAESFHNTGQYEISEEGLNLSHLQLSQYYEKLLSKFEIIYIEDPFYERDVEGWKIFSEKHAKELMVVADDLVVTNVAILKAAIKTKLANAVIVKPNQVGTLSETLDFVKTAKEAQMSVIVSHRSGDTAEDTFIADLGIAVGADFIKAGAPVRGERVAKYNRLLEILKS